MSFVKHIFAFLIDFCDFALNAPGSPKVPQVPQATVALDFPFLKK